MVSSLFPIATLPNSDRFNVHAFGSVKSSSSKIRPMIGRMFTVGVMPGVGNEVDVAVGGNQIIVGVTVVVGGSRVSVGEIMVVGAAVQALHKKINKK